MDPDQQKKIILNFSLDHLSSLRKRFGFTSRGNQGYSRVLLQIFGYIGHGKSSFINSCKYVLEEGEEFIEYANAGDNLRTMTMERKAYDLTKNITMVENRGCITMGSFQRAEIYTQLGNFLPIGEKVEWMKDYTDMMTRLEDAEWNPNYSDFIVPILIFSAKIVLADSERKELQEFLENCVKMTGVFPIIVITHKTSGNFMEAEKTFRLMGAEVVISIENYTEKDPIKTQRRTNDILMVIHRALKDVKYRLGEKGRNPQKDRVQQKKFMLEYIHNAVLEEKKNDLGGEKKLKKETIPFIDWMTPKIVHRGCIHGVDCEMKESENEDVLSLVPMSQRSVHCSCICEEDLEKKERERRREEERRKEELTRREEGMRRNNGRNTGGGWWSWLFGQ